MKMTEQDFFQYVMSPAIMVLVGTWAVLFFYVVVW